MCLRRRRQRQFNQASAAAWVEAVEFFEKHFGFKVAYEHGPFASDDDWMSVHLNVKPRDGMKDLFHA